MIMENNYLSILGDRHTIIIFSMIPTSSSTTIGISFIGIGNHQNRPSA